MKLETKFNPGDEVWAMRYDKPQKYIVNEVHAMASIGFRYVPWYIMSCSSIDAPRFTEDKLFKTKQELIESL